MSEQLSANLVKVLNSGAEKKLAIEGAELEELPLGGIEGKKYRLTVPSPLSSEHGKLAEPLIFIVKESKYDDFDELNEVIKAYRVLYAKGYPVPGTVRRYDQPSMKSYLISSDMTEGGKQWVWGVNDDPTDQELETLREMNFTVKDIADLEIQARAIAEKATADQINLDTYYYHIRKNKETGKVEIILLDIYPKSMFVPWKQEGTNQDKVTEFFKEMRVEMSKLTTR